MNPFEVYSCEHTEATPLNAGIEKNNMAINMDIDDKKKKFIGISLKLHAMIGGHITIGFTV